MILVNTGETSVNNNKEHRLGSIQDLLGSIQDLLGSIQDLRGKGTFIQVVIDTYDQQ